MKATTAAGIAAATAAAALAAGSRIPVVRDAVLHWGATAAEVERALPGDELAPRADVVATRAIRIAAPPAAVWPWLVQMGPGRGGAYTYDWIENLLGLDMHSADRILPEFQEISVGEVIALGLSGPRMRVEVVDIGRALVFASKDRSWVWAFALVPDGAGTRLVSRNRISRPGSTALGRFAYRLVMEPGSLVMERKMLLGIKERAERLATAEGTNGSVDGAQRRYAVAGAERTLDV
ncbi:SRPBCC family protein [Nocardia otitidiscaviarum]|uniref:SRPBCC family protein n=1 Tax=Nocardia otitidiscaviarum TaxID=1823 RepID=UPI001FD0F59D|nr:SRPBCC family protein [Nocardia otitidiscaviarum]MCP9619272.1 SRPBCC family protein [Nocardia otitidiscaviarum]